uniref:Uncharacterized protein n=1 Tax=Anguilla anguilla TaxID=7936 RepID=A0A0E9VG71_ANGAN
MYTVLFWCPSVYLPHFSASYLS